VQLKGARRSRPRRFAALCILACALALAATTSGCSWLRGYQARVRAEEAFARGAAAAERNDLATAQSNFAEALRLEPNSASLHARIGIVYMSPIGLPASTEPPYTELRRAQAARALPHLERALELDPRQPPVVYLQALLAAVRLGREEWARQVLAQVAARFGNDAMWLNNIAYELVDADKLTADALPLLERAVELEPKSGVIVDSLGWAHYRLGDFSRAAELLERASSLTPGNAEIEYHLGVVYAALGRTAQARAQFRRALKLNPALGRAHAALRGLEGR
jgi:tetratricopeptide (TPR) repeat protein